MCNERTSDNVTNTLHTIHKSQLLNIRPQNSKHKAPITKSSKQTSNHKTWQPQNKTWWALKGKAWTLAKCKEKNHENFWSILLSLVGHHHENEGKL